MNIVNKCNGHPLAIVVIGGLLAKSQHSRKHWEVIEANLISRVNSEKEEYCLRILRMSYDHLPMSLKPCFLYMGVYEEDEKIDVSKLIKLWVSEGFVKPRRDNKSLESIAEEYLEELVDRNLVLVYELWSLGNIKSCKMHDFLRDVCLKEAKKQRFFYDVSDHQDSPLGMANQRRIVIRGGSSSAELIDVLESISHVRSILCDHDNYQDLSVLRDFRLLRILSVSAIKSKYRIDDVFEYVNLRFINIHIVDSEIPSSINLLWNLQSFTISSWNFLIAPSEIWKMHQLRHVVSYIDTKWYLPDPPNDSSVIMENLQTLEGVKNLNLNEEVVKRIPNIKTLGLVYDDDGEGIEIVQYCLSYLQYLSKLESFICKVQNRCDKLLQKISFPKSLKKLSLSSFSYCMRFSWEDILPKIGSLPLLQKLTLESGVFRTRKWETIEGQFPSLKVLHLDECGYLESWMVSESSHFPRLQQLTLSFLENLEEIPSEIGEIATLESIVLRFCSVSVVLSAKKILDEQEELHGDQPDLHVEVIGTAEDEVNALQHLVTPNFHFI